MNTSSPHESPDVEREADRLSLIVQAHDRDLRSRVHGSTFDLDGARFELKSKGRNTVYRVKARHSWFLKLVARKNEGAIVREQLGVEMISAALGTERLYRGARTVRLSTSPPYVLAERIPGTQLSRLLFRSCWTPGRSASDHMARVFETLGHTLATLHVGIAASPDTPAATTGPFAKVQGLLERTGQRGRVVDAIAAWLTTHRLSDAGTTFIHANFRLDNVLSCPPTVGFIDFENCGLGSSYQDLSRPISQLALTLSSPLFPVGRIQYWVRAFLQGYERIHTYDRQLLWQFVAARQARHYLESLDKSRLSNRIGGIPITRRGLERLTLTMLAQDSTHPFLRSGA